MANPTAMRRKYAMRIIRASDGHTLIYHIIIINNKIYPWPGV